MPSADRIVEQLESSAYAEQNGEKTSAYAPRFKYQASRFENNNYNVDGLSYPSDLMSDPSVNPYGGNRVIFYINTSVDSRVFKSGTEVAVVEGVQRDMRAGFIGQKVSTTEAIAGSAAIGAMAGGGVGAILGGGSGSAGGAVVGGVVGGAGSATILSQSSQESQAGGEKAALLTRPQKRLRAAIALYIPNQLSVRYSAGWGEEEMMGFMAAAKGASELQRAFQNNTTTGLSSLGKEVISAMAMSGAGPVQVPGAKELGVMTGIAPNPKKEQAFKNVDFRTFTFDYQFAPRDKTEAQNVMNIIRAFKYHMHPEFKSENQFLYIYPSEFDITYYKGANENLHIHRHTSCVLTEMNVNYTPNGVFSTFDNGMPTQIQMTLTFRELMLLTKETIEKFT